MCCLTSYSGCNGLPQSHHINVVELEKERVTELFWLICPLVGLMVGNIRGFFHSFPECLSEIS